MRKTLLALLALAALYTAAPTGAHTSKVSWSTYDTEKRLTVGRFAASNAVKYADCIGTGAAIGKVGTFTRKFKHLECTVQDKDFGNDRQLVVHVRGETTMTVEWLTSKECAAG